MSAIAYITDPKLLELHRIDRNRTINFWRLSSSNSFSDFTKGDLLFFLSKSKNHARNKEKGIVGYGVCDGFVTCSLNTMWQKHGSLNGYQSKKDFKAAICRVAKDHKLPSKISSIYLKEVTFFQSPIYLSDCGMKISNRVESYIYLDPKGKVAFRVLEQAKGHEDLWSDYDDEAIIEKAQIRSALYAAYDMIGLHDEFNKPKRALAELKKYIAANDGFAPIKDSCFEGYKIFENNLIIVFAPLNLNDKLNTNRLMIGQAAYYRMLLFDHYPYDLNVIFRTTNHDVELENYMNQ